MALRHRVEREQVASVAEARPFDFAVVTGEREAQGGVTFAKCVADYAERAGVSAGTRARYRYFAKCVAEWRGATTPAHRMTYQHVVEFERYLRGRPGARKGTTQSSNTVGMYVGLAGTAFDELLRAGVVASSPFASYRKPKRKAPKHRTLSREQVAALESAELFGEVAKWRDRMLFNLWTGLRVRDALAVEAKHFRCEGGELRMRLETAKQKVVVDLPLSSLFAGKPARLIEPYLEAESGRGDGLLWPTATYRVARNRFDKVLEWCGVDVEDFHPHMLRHTFGTMLAEANVPREVIQILMGHLSMQSTAIYSVVSQGAADAAVGAATW